MEQTSTSTKKVNSSPVQYDYTQHSGLEVAPDSGLHAIEPDQGLYQLEPDSGLQVREPDRDNKEAAPPGYGYKHDGYNDGSGAPEAYDGNNLPETYHGQNGEEPPLPPTPNKRRKRLWIIIGVVALVVILAAVLGGVFGSRAANSDNDSAPVQSAVSSSTSSIRPTPTSNSTTSATPTPSTLAKLSALSSGYFPNTYDGSPAGRQKGGIRVFAFQNPEGHLWATISHLEYNNRGRDQYSDWQALQDVRINNGPLVPQKNTGFALSGYATALVDNVNSSLIHYDVNINVYYVSEDGILRGLKYIDGLANRGIQTDPGISKHNYTVRTGSRVAAYHPWIVFQDISGFINVADAHSEDESFLATNLKPIHGMSGTHLAVVPLSSNYDKIIDSSYGIFYQDLDGYLTPLIPGSKTGGSSQVESSWPDSMSFSFLTSPSAILSPHTSHIN